MDSDNKKPDTKPDCINCKNFLYRSNTIEGKFGHCASKEFEQKVTAYCVNVTFSDKSFVQVGVQEGFSCKYFDSL